MARNAATPLTLTLSGAAWPGVMKMADFRYFADVNGETIRLTNIWHNGGVSSKASAFTGLLPTGERVACTRKVEFKSWPSLHKCDARCTNARGFKCECSCGGKNHGKGAAILCEAA